MADDFIAANYESNIFDQASLAGWKQVGDTITAVAQGKVPTHFMGIVDTPSVDMKATAARQPGVSGTIEISLVLDNTFSMAEADAKGVKKIDALKAAATTLVNKVNVEPEGGCEGRGGALCRLRQCRHGYRDEKWLDVEKDKTTGTEKVCVTKTTQTQSATRSRPTPAPRSWTACRRRPPAGAPHHRTCKDVTVKEYQSCTRRLHQLHLVRLRRSRKVGVIKLDDKDKSSPIPAMRDLAGCPTPLLTLSTTRARS